MAEHALTTSRRSHEPARGLVDRRSIGAALLAVVAGSGITAGAAASVADLVPANPDAELLDLCTRYIATKRAWDAVFEAEQEDCDEVTDAKARPLIAHMDVLLDRMFGLRATTADGVVILAAALAAENGDFGSSFDYPRTPPHRLLAMVLRDAVHLAGSA